MLLLYCTVNLNGGLMLNGLRLFTNFLSFQLLAYHFRIHAEMGVIKVFVRCRRLPLEDTAAAEPRAMDLYALATRQFASLRYLSSLLCALLLKLNGLLVA